MTKGLNAACCISQSLIAASFQPLWISDALLADTYRRFASSHRRHGSNVPGPLEARRRSARRKNTSLAYAQVGPAPIDPAILLNNRPSLDWWPARETPPKSYGEPNPEGVLRQYLIALDGSKFVPLWRLNLPELPQLNNPVENELSEETQVGETSNSYAYFESHEEELCEKVNACRNIEELRLLLQYQPLSLRLSATVNTAICDLIAQEHKAFGKTGIASFVTDPIFHPSGTTNHVQILRLLRTRPTPQMDWSVLNQAFNTAIRLGLLSPTVFGKVVLLLPLLSSKNGKDPNTFESEDHSSVVTLQLLKSLEASAVFKTSDVSSEVIEQLSIRTLSNHPSCEGFSLLTYLSSKASNVNLDGNDILYVWLKSAATIPRAVSPCMFVKVLQNMPSESQALTMVQITRKLVSEIQESGLGRNVLLFWHEVLSTFTEQERLQLSHSKDHWIPFLSNSTSGLSLEDDTFVRVWTLLALHKRPSQMLSQEARNALHMLIDQLSVFVHPTQTTSDDLTNHLLQRLEQLPLPHTRALINAIINISSTPTNASIFLNRAGNQPLLQLRSDDFYLKARKNNYEALLDIVESVNKDIHLFKHLARALIHKNKTAFKVITRTLSHNQAFQVALSQSFPQRREQQYSKCDSNIHSIYSSKYNLTPTDALEVMNNLAVSFALTKVVHPRSAFLRVHWCYMFLHRYGGPIQAPIARALWHAGVVRYGKQGCSKTQLNWILRKVHEIEGRETAHMLAQSTMYRSGREKSMEALDWSDEQFFQLEKTQLAGETDVSLPREYQSSEQVLSSLDPEKSGSTILPCEQQARPYPDTTARN